MNPAQVHLALNHFPIIGLLFTLIFLAYGIFVKSETIQRFSMVMMIFVALTTVPVFLSGEPAEEIIEETTSVSHKLIHEHEEAGELAFFVMEALGLLSIVALYLMRINKLSNPLKYLILVMGIVTFLLMARAGSLGGEIMHPETGIDMAQHEDEDH